MVKEYNEQKLRKELIHVYKGFIKDKKNKTIYNEMFRLNFYYFNATGFMRSKAVGIAYNKLAFLIQEDYFKEGEEIKEAKKMLENLKNDSI